MRLHLCLTFAIHLSAVGSSVAQDKWPASPLDGASVPPEIVEETRHLASGGLPDGLVDRYESDGDIASACYAGPTSRYRHGVLGDAETPADFASGKAGRPQLCQFFDPFRRPFVGDGHDLNYPPVRVLRTSGLSLLVWKTPV